MLRKAILTFLFTLFLIFSFEFTYSADTSESSLTTMGVVDKGTFNEYKYRITEQYINLRSKFEVDETIDTIVAQRIRTLAEEGFKYLPDDLINRNYLSSLKSAIDKGVKYSQNSSYFQDVATSIENYLTKVTIQSVKGSVEASPKSGNAPMSTTLRGSVVDPTGTKLENYNYTWWMNIGGKRVVIGNKVSINYVFKEEGNYAVFLDVTSNHKNATGYVDVLPFSSRVDIEVKEKIASIVLKINNITLGNEEEIKFNPDEARYGLLFDATSSTPTSGAKFTRTEWDFGNGVKRSYDGSPQIERVVYASEGEYTVKLNLRTNELKTVEKKFVIKIHQPIATIQASAEEGYMGDKITFTASSNGNRNNLTYKWTIIDIDNDIEVVGKNSSTFSYTFKEKGKYNVQLWVTEASGDIDMDSKIIYINSRAPEAKFTYSIPNLNKPNTVFLDATASFDPDYSDDGKLTYSWEIDGQRVNLTNPNFNGSNGYHTFSSIGDHSVMLEVIDPDNMNAIKTEKINIGSILSVDFNAFPRVSQIDKTVRFVADSPRAQYYEWDFKDGNGVEGTESDMIAHVFKRSGVYQVKLKVYDKENNTENTLEKNVYIGDADYPYAFITLKDSIQNDIIYKSGECGGEGAYIVDRSNTFTFSGEESLDVTGDSNNGLSYSWVVGNGELRSGSSFQKKFDELGCLKVKLSVVSDKTGRISTQEVNVKVENIKPTLSSLDLRVKDIEADPVIVNVVALGAKDPDGVIQSYLWYYYTDLDPEPQDFRSTVIESTTFVLPKVTGNYYFVVVMKDNNEARVNSEDISSKYFITLTGDNINTPIVDLKVNKNSVSIGDEVIFTAEAQNILGQSLNNVASFSWDFDGDGFYDQETNTNSITYKYNSSGEKPAKVRVKYKGFSNTKTLTINVANILKPEFDYVSIGNSFIFFDNSLSNNAKYEWDMGDGNKVVSQGSFIYTYIDGQASHNVVLKLTEGTKIQELTKKVIKNMPNFLVSSREPLAIYSNFEIIDGEVTIDDNLKELYFYLSSNNKNNVKNYVADFDINYDSDLNGGNDDDEDNKSENSYKDGTPILINLNNNREQIVRLYIKDEDGGIIATKDVKVVKTYISESIDVNSITFEGVSESVKFKLEKIKQIISSFPQDSRLRAMMYIQRLQEEWNDDREKTNIILEFEGFIEEFRLPSGELSLPSGAELIDLLESLLVEIPDPTGRLVLLNALKNLIPTTIVCTPESQLELGSNMSCYELLVSKLEAIYESSNIDENKVLGTIILENIATDTVMTVKQKNDFKAILQTFVYGFVSDIPEEEKEEVIENEPKEGGGILNIIGSIFKGLFVILLVIVGVVLLFFVYYKIANKDKNVSFTDFIGEKMGSSGKKKTENLNEDFGDILGDDILEEKGEDSKIGEIGTSSQTSYTEGKEDDIKTETNINKEKEPEKIEEVKPSINSEIPEWLRGNFSEELLEDLENAASKATTQPSLDEKSVKTEPFKGEETFTQENAEESENKGEVPDWLKGSFSDFSNGNVEDSSLSTSPTIEENIKESDSSSFQESEQQENVEIPAESNTSGEVPEWLKGNSLSDGFTTELEETTEPQAEVSEVEENIDTEPKLETKEELDEFTKLELDEDRESEIPDWLKGSMPADDNSMKDDDSVEDDVNVGIQSEVIESDDSSIKSDNSTESTVETIQQEEIASNDLSVDGDKQTELSQQEEITSDVTLDEKLEDTKVNLEKKKEEKEKNIIEKKKESGTRSRKKPTKSNKSSKPKTPPKKEEETQKSQENTEAELWDDGMKIPDWLKTDDEK